jgi:hypothetical protein
MIKKNKSQVMNSSKPHMFYTLKFASIITPHAIKNLSLSVSTSNFINSYSKHKKLFVKQSYILLVWLVYLKKEYSTKNNRSKIPSFFIHKKKQTKTTKLKTPMAHKTFSQEQFLLKFYYLSISFQVNHHPNIYPQSINTSLYTFTYLRKTLPFFSTNLLFLKRIGLTYQSKDTNFMHLY